MPGAQPERKPNPKDKNHEYGEGYNIGNTDMMFKTIHCAISIVGNYQNGKLIQYWWGVTPALICFKKGNPERIVRWTLDLRDIQPDQGGVWENAGWNDNDDGKTGGIVMDKGWDPDNEGWGTPERDGDGYKLVIPPNNRIPVDVAYGYTVSWKVNGIPEHFDPELEVGEN